mmetsp:Transcript_23383/g.47431  ORF Transcript_23383/g.47431 Transcript_23383/m.47431 type:complete len:337 (-) Transcript_23383:68-1078(-)
MCHCYLSSGLTCCSMKLCKGTSYIESSLHSSLEFVRIRMTVLPCLAVGPKCLTLSIPRRGCPHPRSLALDRIHGLSQHVPPIPLGRRLRHRPAPLHGVPPPFLVGHPFHALLVQGPHEIACRLAPHHAPHHGTGLAQNGARSAPGPVPVPVPGAVLSEARPHHGANDAPQGRRDSHRGVQVRFRHARDGGVERVAVRPVPVVRVRVRRRRRRRRRQRLQRPRDPRGAIRIRLPRRAIPRPKSPERRGAIPPGFLRPTPPPRGPDPPRKLRRPILLRPSPGSFPRPGPQGQHGSKGRGGPRRPDRRFQASRAPDRKEKEGVRRKRAGRIRHNEGRGS